ncbi:hypothetical protein SKAU_G00165530 [Synaphobranchus kaupii]|uniref:Uncharacterized protein n=1 Tax=Synaphobranchus kaupii TaxID=118154 RepID=A0A9Q1FJI7_SYNKA|nr:hypothetical protein SKAU_G00165530 [Synaphobranchus kaupii]
MPVRTEIFPQLGKRSQSPKVPGRSEGPGVCVLPSIPESPALQGQTQSPVRTRTSPSLYILPLWKVFSPPRQSGSKAVMDSFIYENWRVHPCNHAPRRAFEDDRQCSGGERGKRESLDERPVKLWVEDALKRSAAREAPDDQCIGNRARRCGVSCSTIISEGVDPRAAGRRRATP